MFIAVGLELDACSLHFRLISADEAHAPLCYVFILENCVLFTPSKATQTPRSSRTRIDKPRTPINSPKTMKCGMKQSPKTLSEELGRRHLTGPIRFTQSGNPGLEAGPP